MNEVILTSTAGQIAVGGRICCLNSPKSHSGLTCEAHLLCNCTSQFTPHSDVHARISVSSQIQVHDILLNCHNNSDDDDDDDNNNDNSSTLINIFAHFSLQ